MTPILVQHSLTLTIGRNPLIRRAVNDIEDLVKAASEHGFVQPQIVPVPDEFGPEMPRLIFESRGGHTQLLVSQLGVTFNAQYSEDWARDPQRCLVFMAAKVDLLFEIARAGWRTTRGPSFSAIATTIRVPTVSRAASVEMLRQLFSDVAGLGDAAGEVSCRWSRSREERFFDNVAAQTFITVDESLVQFKNGLPMITDAVISDCGVEIAGDFNDRLAFNSSTDYVSDPAGVKAMLTRGYESAQDALRAIGKG